MSNTALHATLVGRITAAFGEALEEIGVADNWMETAIRELLPHIACEMIAEEQHRGRPMSLTEAARWLCDQAEVKA
jgi:hypothetical protein